LGLAGLNPGAVPHLIGKGCGDEIPSLEAVQDLDGWTIVTADLDRLQMNVAVSQERDDVSILPYGNGVAGDGEWAGTVERVEGNDGVHCGKQTTIAIVDLDLSEEGAGLGIDGGRGSSDAAADLRSGQFLKVKGCFLSCFDGAGVSLGTEARMRRRPTWAMLKRAPPLPPVEFAGEELDGPEPLEREEFADPGEELPPVWAEEGPAPPAEPAAEMRAPMSTLRAVTTPSNGAVTCS